MTRNTRPRNCRNGADGDTAASIKPCNLRKWPDVKRLVLTHHDPEHDDEFLERIEKLCQERFSNAVLAREGMEIAI